MGELRTPRELRLDPGRARVLDANRRSAEHLQAEGNGREHHQFEETPIRDEGIGRDRKIQELMARIRELEKEKSTNQSATEHRTMTPPEPTQVAEDDLKDVFLDPFATNVSAHTIIPAELFATPRESVDLIDLSTPPREDRAGSSQDL